MVLCGPSYGRDPLAARRGRSVRGERVGRHIFRIRGSSTRGEPRPRSSRRKPTPGAAPTARITHSAPRRFRHGQERRAAPPFLSCTVAGTLSTRSLPRQPGARATQLLRALRQMHAYRARLFAASVGERSGRPAGSARARVTPQSERPGYRQETRLDGTYAPLSVERRRRLVARCRHRPIAQVATERGISRQCTSKWVPSPPIR